MRLRPLPGELGATEITVAFVLASTLWLPAVLGGRSWALPVAVLFALALYSVFKDRRLAPVPIALILYVAVYVVAALHGGDLSSSTLARYFVKPLAALALAQLIVGHRQRMRILVLILAFIAVEIPVTAGQAIENVVQFGRHATVAADSVTGTLGTAQAGTVTLVAVFAATLVIAAWVARLITWRIGLIAAAAFVSVGVFSATRAVLAFVPVAAIGVASIAVHRGPDRSLRRRVIILVAASLVAAPALYGAMIGIYPHSFTGAFSSQTTSALGGAASYFGIPTCTGAAASKNLVQNGDFEGRQVVWTSPGGGLLAFDTAKAKFGRTSLKLVSDKKVRNQSWAESPIPVCKGRVYVASAWVWAPRGQRIGLSVSNYVKSRVHVVEGSGHWQLVRLGGIHAVTAPQSEGMALPGTDSYMDLEVFAKGRVAMTIWIDRVTLRAQPVPHRPVISPNRPAPPKTKPSHPPPPPPPPPPAAAPTKESSPTPGRAPHHAAPDNQLRPPPGPAPTRAAPQPAPLDTSTAAGTGACSKKNLLQNGGFEGGISPWTATGGAVVRSSRKALSGRRSLNVSVRSSRTVQFAITRQIDVCAGRVYRATAWIWAPPGSAVELVLSDGKVSRGGFVVGGGGWQLAETYLALPATRSSITVAVVPVAPSSALSGTCGAGVVPPGAATSAWVDDATLGVRDTLQTPQLAMPPNGAFEDGTVGWAPVHSARLSSHRIGSKGGSRGLRIQADGSRGEQGAISVRFPVCRGRTYTAKASVWAPKGTAVELVAADGKVATGDVAVGKGRWQSLSLRFRPKEDFATIEIFPRHPQPPGLTPAEVAKIWPRLITIKSTIWVDGVRAAVVRQRGAKQRQSVPPGAAKPTVAPTPPAAPHAPTGVELLPGRLAQLRLALRLSIDSGIVPALIGHGLGSAQLDPAYHLAQYVPAPQRTGSTSVGTLLTETGWLGLLGFVGLLAWLAFLGRRLWRRSTAASDRALGAALPGIAALTLLGAIFTTVLDVRGYSIAFWLLVGVALSAARDVGAYRVLPFPAWARASRADRPHRIPFRGQTPPA